MQIENAITEGQLRAGDRLPPERELAELFQVSRPSVREALRVLEVFGVISARRGRGVDSGSVVTAVDHNGLSSVLRLYAAVLEIPLTDLIELREAIDMLAVRSAAAKATPAQLAELAALVEEMGVVTEPEAFHEFDTEFHVTLARVSGNAAAPLLVEAFRGAISREMLRGFAALEDWPAERNRLVAEHAEIVELVAAGDGERAAEAVAAHIRGFYQRALGDIAADHEGWSA